MLAFHGIRKPITRLTTVCRRQMHLVRKLITSLTFYLLLVLSTHLRLSTTVAFPSRFGIRISHAFLTSPIRATLPSHLTSFMRSGSRNMAAQWPYGVYTVP